MGNWLQRLSDTLRAHAAGRGLLAAFDALRRAMGSAPGRATLLGGLGLGGLLVWTAVQAAIAYTGTSGSSSSSATSVSVTRPTGSSNGDLMLVFLANRGTANVNLAPSGWTRRGPQSVGTGTSMLTFTAYYKVLDASDPSSFTFQYDGTTTISATAAAFSGVDAVDPIDSAFYTTQAATTALLMPSVDTTSNNAMLVYGFAQAHGGATITTASPLTSVQERAAGTTTAGVAMDLSYLQQTTAGATGDRTATSTQSAIALNVVVALRPAGTHTISGTVFEDVNYGGGAGRSLAASGGAGLANARVELYDNSGTFVAATATAVGGAYTFTGVGSGAYTVRVVNSSVTSSRAGASASQVGVMTYRTEAASGTAVAVTDHVGGLDPASVDAAAGAGGTVLWTLCAAENATCSFAGTRIVRYGAYAAGSSRWTTRVLTGGTACTNGVFGDPYSGVGKNCYVLNDSYQSVANVAVGTAAVSGIDFGFNFSTIVNTNNSGQGSLRQFITNASALGGKAALAQSGNRRDLGNVAQALPAATETSIFMIPGGVSVGGLRSTVPSQLTSGVAPIVLTSSLPQVALAGVSLDGSTQTANVGDTNAGLLGTGGTVGVDALTLSQVPRPEVELTFASLSSGITIAANNVTVRALALRSTGAAALGNGAVALNNDTTGAVIEGNVIGTRATALVDPGAGQYVGVGVYSNGADSGTVRNNLITYFTTTGVQLAGTLSSTWTISGNEIRDGGLDFDNTDGVALTSATAVTVSGNRITGMSTQGIVFGSGSGTGAQIVNNTFSGNGVGPANAASGQSNVVVARSGASGVRVEANVITANYGAGIAINSGAIGIALTRNLVYGNGTIASRNGTAATGQIDIDLNAAADNANLGTAPFVTANDSGDADAGGNNLQNFPVLSSAVISGGTQLIVSGTLNSNAGGYYRIEFFGNSSQHASGNGGGQTYLGFANVATDGSGNASFSTTLTATVAMGSYVTATAAKSDASYATLTDTSEFSPNVQAGLSVQGTVFEDVNYGGGAGRSRAASGGVGLDGARVELYDAAGAFVSATTTAGGGAYRFDVPATGAYLLRVVSSSVPSSRSGYTASLVGVMTFRGDGTSGTVLPVTNFVGGTNPALVDPGNGASGAVLNSSTFVFSAGPSGTAQAVAPITVSGASIAGVDFGFNFDTVVNTNDSGQGSLRQAMTNANTLGNDGNLAQSGRTAAIENLVFMIGNGSAAAGLRSAVNLFSGGVATVSLTSALPAISAPLVVDARTQPGWSSSPVVALSGGNPGIAFDGPTVGVGAGGSTLAGLAVGNFKGNGVSINGNGNTVAANHVGVNAAGTAAWANTAIGINVYGNNNMIGGTVAGAGNVVAGNGGVGISLGTASTGNTVAGNLVGVNAAGTAAIGNGSHGVSIWQGSNNTIGGTTAAARNVIGGQSGAAAVYVGDTSATGNVVQGNYIGTGSNGTTAIGNQWGVIVDAVNTTVGGTAAGAGNLITNGTSGVTINGYPIANATGNAVLGNSIYGNGSGPGIDLVWNGFTANDGAKTNGQPNLLMDSPVFTAARSRGTQLTVTGYIGTAAGQSAFAGSRVEVFISDSSSTRGSGRTYLGALTADGSGNFSGTVTMPYSALRAGSVLAGTATDTSNNTSEFGANFSGLIVDWLINHNGDGVDANPGDGLCETSTPGQCTLRAAIMETNAWAGADLAYFDLPSCPGAGCVITPASALPAITGQLLLDGQTQPGWTSAPLVDLRGEGAGANSDGLTVDAANSVVRGLAVGGFLQSGIRINANNVTVEGVYAGVAPDGTTARANGASNSATGGVYVAGGTGIVIGGTTATTRNVLSGNGGAGVWANAGTATIIGNYVGTNAAGTTALGNSRWGVYLFGGTAHKLGGSATGEGNVISGNFANQKGGVYLVGSGYTIQGNTIGLNAARTAAVPNGDGSTNNAAGIDARSGSGHLIGGTGAGEGNVISGNQGYGVSIRSQSTRVLGNSIYNNLWLGIDLGADGVTANNGTQSGALPNNDVDHPVITSAGYDPLTRALTLTGYVGTGTGQALFAGARIELFTSDGDASGFGEGSAFVGNLTADANGRFSGTVSVPLSVTFAVGTALTGTATDTASNTSEFGPNYVTTTMSALVPSRFNAFETSTAANALAGPIQTRVAGVAGGMALIAIDSAGTGLQTAFAGSVTLEWMNAADNSGALDAGNCRASWVAAGSAGSASFVSGDQGRISTSLTPAAVGREWRLRISHTGPGGTVTSCATDPFAVRPASLVITGVSDSDDITAGTTRVLDNLAASGGRVHHAGRPFSLRAAAHDAASAVTAGYDGTPSIAITSCVLPAGCTAGALSAPALAASSGLIAADTLSYSEVGAINLQLTDDSFADIDTADTPLLQRRIQSAAVGVGRFVPDRYLLAVGTSPQFATQQGACAAAGQGFTYVGQTFGWAATPSFTVTAQNAAGATTALWSGALQKLSTAHVARSLAAANAQGLTPVVTWGTMSLTDTGAGTASVALSGDQVLFARDASTPVASFNPLITLGIAVSDTSEVAVSGNSAIASVSALVIGSGTGIAFNQGSNFHYGRLKLQNAFGDARRGVRANVELQKFTDRGWLRLSEDNTCLTVPVASIAFSAGSGAFATDVCTAPATTAIALRQGRGTLVLPRTAGNVQGAAMVTLDIGPTLEGSACAAGLPVTPTSAAWPHLLGARGTGTTQDQNPAARLVWGRQHRDYMVMRELF
jgi:Right handed beta helix region/SdrD B-like domain